MNIKYSVDHRSCQKIINNNMLVKISHNYPGNVVKPHFMEWLYAIRGFIL